MAFTFRVYLADGTDLDDYNAARPDWNPGDLLYKDGQPRYRINAVIPMHDPDNDVYAGIWEVEPVLSHEMPVEPMRRSAQKS